jgi:predicted nucleic acid-binding protein
MPDPSGREVQYWDSVLFTSFITETLPERVQAFRQLLRNLQMPLGNYRLVLSTLVITEVRPPGTGNAAHERIVEELFDADRPYIRFYAVTRRIAALARDLVIQFSGLTNPDAIHLATAVEARADVFFTYDGARDTSRRRSGGLLRLNGQIGSPPLRIVTPDQELWPLFNQPPSVT